MSIAVEDSHLRLAILAHLVEIAERGRFHQLAAGADLQQVEAFRRMSTAQLILLANQPQARIHVALDHSGFAHTLQILSATEARNRQLEYFIQAGAPVNLICRMFRLSPEVVDQQRDLLLPNVRPGRPQMPSPAEREIIQQAWHELTAGRRDAGPDDWIALHQRFPQHSLATLHRTVYEFGELSGGA